MTWLSPETVLPMAGYPVADPLPERQAAAVTYAEQVIEQRTGLVWGDSRVDTLTVRLSAASYLLRVPRDATSVKVLSPAISHAQMTQLARHGLELFDSAWDQLPWRQGTYRLEVTRGIAVIPEPVNRAAALLVGHHLSYADHSRSQFDGLTLGDFSGARRRDAFPVPEAEQLLRPWLSNVGVSL